MKRLMVAALALVMSSAMWVAAQADQAGNSGNSSKAGAGSNSNAAGVCR